MYKAHPNSCKLLLNHVEHEISKCEFTTTVRKTIVVPDAGIPEKETVYIFPDWKFVEWEEKDLEWAVPLGLIQVYETRIPYKKSVGGTMNLKLNTFDVRRFEDAYFVHERHSRNPYEHECLSTEAGKRYLNFRG